MTGHSPFGRFYASAMNESTCLGFHSSLSVNWTNLFILGLLHAFSFFRFENLTIKNKNLMIITFANMNEIFSFSLQIHSLVFPTVLHPCFCAKSETDRVNCQTQSGGKSLMSKIAHFLSRTLKQMARLGNFSLTD